MARHLQKKPDTSQTHHRHSTRPNASTAQSASLSSSSLLQLQRTIGNQAVMRMLKTDSPAPVQRAPDAETDEILSSDALLTRWGKSIEVLEKEVHKEKLNVRDYYGLAAQKALRHVKK